VYVTFEDICTFDVVGRRAGESGDAAAEPLGKLADVYIDTRDWRISWLVLESGGLLGSNRVLIGSERRIAFDTAARRIVTDLTDYDVETARGADELRTVSDQREADAAIGGSGAGSGGLPLGPGGDGLDAAGAGGAALAPDAGGLPPSEEERHMRSASELVGYAVAGRDEEVGTVRDLLIDTDLPEIAWLSVDVGSWLEQREVVIRPSWTTALSWSEQRLSVDLSREQVRGAPPLTALRGLDRAYASALARFYRLPGL